MRYLVGVSAENRGRAAVAASDEVDVDIELGDDVRLFGSPGTPRVDLERTSVGQSGRVTDLRFRVAKARPLTSRTGGAE